MPANQLSPQPGAGENSGGAGGVEHSVTERSISIFRPDACDASSEISGWKPMVEVTGMEGSYRCPKADQLADLVNVDVIKSDFRRGAVIDRIGELPLMLRRRI